MVSPRPQYRAIKALIRGGGSWATFLAFAIPLGSMTRLCAAPIAPKLGRTPPTAPAEPPPRANEPAVEAKTTKNTDATFTAVFDMGSSSKLTPPGMERKFEKPADTTKLKF